MYSLFGPKMITETSEVSYCKKEWKDSKPIKFMESSLWRLQLQEISHLTTWECQKRTFSQQWRDWKVHFHVWTTPDLVFHGGFWVQLNFVSTGPVNTYWIENNSEFHWPLSNWFKRNWLKCKRTFHWQHWLLCKCQDWNKRESWLFRWFQWSRETIVWNRFKLPEMREKWWVETVFLRSTTFWDMQSTWRL